MMIAITPSVNASSRPLCISFFQSPPELSRRAIFNLSGGNRVRKGLFDPFRVTLEQGDQGKRRFFGRIAALLPVLQGTKLEAEQGGEFPLRKSVTRANRGDVDRVPRFRASQSQRDPERSEIPRKSGQIRFGIDRAYRRSRFGQAIECLMRGAERYANGAQPAQDVDRAIERPVTGQDDDPAFGKRGGRVFVRDRRQTCEARPQF
nr:hypothetical protein [Acidibrevibacterium fodinaquatile]